MYVSVLQKKYMVRIFEGLEVSFSCEVLHVNCIYYPSYKDFQSQKYLSFKGHVRKEFALGCTAQFPVVTPRGCQYLQILVCACWLLQLSWTPQMVSQMDISV